MMAEKLTSAPTLSQKVVAAVMQHVSPAGPAPVMARREAVTDDERRLSHRHGVSWPQVAELLLGSPELAEMIDQSTMTRRVDIVHAIRNQMALSLDDVVLRRLYLAQSGHPGIDALRACAAVVAAELRLDPQDSETRVLALDRWLSNRGLPAA